MIASVEFTEIEKAVADAIGVSAAFVKLARHHDENMSWPVDEEKIQQLALELAQLTATHVGDTGLLRPGVCRAIIQPLVDFSSEAEESEAVEEFVDALHQALLDQAANAVETKSAFPVSLVDDVDDSEFWAR